MTEKTSLGDVIRLMYEMPPVESLAVLLPRCDIPWFKIKPEAQVPIEILEERNAAALQYRTWRRGKLTVAKIPDIGVLEGFEEPFIDRDGNPRDVRMVERWDVAYKQLYAIWNKDRFCRMIDSGVTLRSGWLTEIGKRELAHLRAHNLLNILNRRIHGMNKGWILDP